MKYNLTNDEANTIKDILRVIGEDEDITDGIAKSLGMTVDAFNDTTDLIYSKLGNPQIQFSSSRSWLEFHGIIVKQ